MRSYCFRISYPNTQKPLLPEFKHWEQLQQLILAKVLLSSAAILLRDSQDPSQHPSSQSIHTPCLTSYQPSLLRLEVQSRSSRQERSLFLATSSELSTCHTIILQRIQPLYLRHDMGRYLHLPPSNRRKSRRIECVVICPTERDTGLQGP